MNNADVSNTGKYEIADGNEELIHLCEQNHSSFEGAYETAIEFQRNDIFKYLYEKKIEDKNNLEELGSKCIKANTYDILSFLEEIGMKVNDLIINVTVESGNLFLFKHVDIVNKIQKEF